MRTIQLTQGKETLVDDVDFDLLTEFKFFYGGGYAKTSIDGKAWFLHHVLLGRPPDGFVIDHINRNSLDNQRKNLRVVTQAFNLKNNSSYGIRQRENGKWQLRIQIDKKTFSYTFKTEQEALDKKKQIWESQNI